MIGALLGSVGIPALAKAGMLGAGIGKFALSHPAILGAIGSGLGSFLQNKDPKQALAAGLGGYGASKAFGALTSGEGAFGNSATATNNVPLDNNLASQGLSKSIIDATNTPVTPTLGQSLIDTATNPATLASIAGSALVPPPPPMNNMDVDEMPPEGMAPALMTNRPPEGYRAGVDPEYNYKFPLNYYGGGIMKYQQGGMQNYNPSITEDMIGDFPYLLQSDANFDKEAMMAKRLGQMMGEEEMMPNIPTIPKSRPNYLKYLYSSNVDLPESRPQPTTFMNEFEKINEKYLNPIFPTPSMGVEALLEMLSKNKKLKEAKAALPKQEGGMLPDEQMIQEDIMAESVPPEGMPNDKDIINSAVQAIKGESQNPEIALGAFLQMFGEEALRDLVARVQSGEFDMNADITEGLLTGVGDGMDDMIPATLEGEQDVVLSDGEFIVPADVVSGIGNGSTESGSRRLYDMMDRVRMMRGGSLKQPPDVSVGDMLPV